jgi:hypothetical protein
LRSGLSVFVDGLVRREGLDFEVSSDSEVHFIPAVAGGARPAEPGRAITSALPSLLTPNQQDPPRKADAFCPSPALWAPSPIRRGNKKLEGLSPRPLGEAWEL